MVQPEEIRLLDDDDDAQGLYTPAPKKGRIHNALKPVAASVPRARLKQMTVTQGEMMATFLKRTKS